MKYGVCRCDLTRYNPTAEMLEIFDSYEDAAAYYIKCITEKQPDLYIRDPLWVVFIEDGHIVQFDRLERVSRTKIVPFKMVQNSK